MMSDLRTGLSEKRRNAQFIMEGPSAASAYRSVRSDSPDPIITRCFIKLESENTDIESREAV